MSNPWLNHVANFRKEHKDLSYKEALIGAKATYKKQKGKGPYGAEAEAAAAVVGTLGDVSKGAIDAIQTDKAHSGRYDKSKFDKKTREFGRLKRKMDKAKFPSMSDAELMKYIDKEYGNL